MNNVQLSSTSQTAREAALRLENDKRKLEEELKEWLSILEKVSVLDKFLIS